MQKKTEKGASVSTIGIDLMGSDAHPSSLFEKLIPVFQEFGENSRFVLFGEHPLSFSLPSVSFEVCSESISPEDHPLRAVRQKTGSSLRKGLEALQEGKIDAFISMGNTGALVAGARTVLGTLPSIPHPALLVCIPTKTGRSAVLDVGANVEYTATDLVGFAAIGIAYQQTAGIEHPSVALLNIGTEELKGPKELREAYQTLSDLSTKKGKGFFRGNIEGRDLFEGSVDIMVTGGFAGNVFLKSAEGAALFLLDRIGTSSGGLLEQFDYKRYPGAILAGVNGIVLKCHGTGHPEALRASVISCLELIRGEFLQKISTEVTSFFSGL